MRFASLLLAALALTTATAWPVVAAAPGGHVGGGHHEHGHPQRSEKQHEHQPKKAANSQSGEGHHHADGHKTDRTWKSRSFPQDKIKHVVVLMLENRAFDHMCGWLGKWIPGVDGLTGNEYNVANGTRYYVNDTSPYVGAFDPDHSVKGTTLEVMGMTQRWINPEPMSGFAEHHWKKQEPHFDQVMHGFSPDRVPAISTLAKNFAVFDRYYASLPGPTYPNRMYFLTGTSYGMTDNDIIDYLPGLPQKTIMKVLDDNNITWRNYFTDLPDMLLLKEMRTLQNLKNLRFFDDFMKDAAAGDLPAFSWVNPRFIPTFTDPAQDQHPDHDVVLGEKVIAQLYDALRSSPVWNHTAFVVTYDEHGGYYDHVAPPEDNVPNPDGMVAPDGFNFTRLGLRVCHVVASPWIPAGTVVHEPATAPAHRYEHQSTFQTLRHLYGFDDILTNRTMFAASYDHVFSLESPRTDAPMTLPTPSDFDKPAAYKRLAEEQSRKPPNALQRELFAVAEAAAGVAMGDITQGRHIKTQGELAVEAKKLIQRAVWDKVDGHRKP